MMMHEVHHAEAADAKSVCILFLLSKSKLASSREGEHHVIFSPDVNDVHEKQHNGDWF